MNEEVKQRYLLKLDEINLLSATLAVAAMEREGTEQAAKEAFFDTLLDMYVEGWAAAAYIMGEEIGGVTDETVAGLQAALTGRRGEETRREVTGKEYDGESIGEKFSVYFREGDGERIKSLVESEAHRCYSLGAFKAAEENGRNVTWRTLADDRVRETHVYLEGVTVRAGEYFYTFDGDRARFPGDFTLAQNNANCRCYIEIAD